MKVTKKHADGTVEWAIEVTFEKSTEERLVHGIVYEPDVVDSQGDYASAEEICKACHNFMIEKGELGVMHKESAGPRATIVENYIAPAEFMLGSQRIKKGTWMMAVKVHDDELWGAVKKGEITGFSMGGRAECDKE